MITRCKFVLIIVACLLGGSFLFLVSQSQIEEIRRRGSGSGFQSPQTLEDPQRSEGHLVMRERGESVSNSRIKVDRSSPKRALDTILQSLSSSKFDQFFESFSKTGKERLTGGVEINEQEMLSMRRSFTTAGFEGLQVVSEVVEVRGDLVVADVTVESKRRGRTITEKLEVTFSELNGEWFADSFEVVSVPN